MYGISLSLSEHCAYRYIESFCWFYTEKVCIIPITNTSKKPQWDYWVCCTVLSYSGYSVFHSPVAPISTQDGRLFFVRSMCFTIHGMCTIWRYVWPSSIHFCGRTASPNVACALCMHDQERGQFTVCFMAMLVLFVYFRWYVLILSNSLVHNDIYL